MESYIPALEKARLFTGFTREELHRLLDALQPTERTCPAGAVLLHAGSENRQIGVVLEGAIEAVKYTAGGGQFTVSRMGPGGVFGDILSGSHAKSPATVYATAPSRVLFLPMQRLLATPPPGQHALLHRLLANLVAVISDKYFALDARVDLLLTHSLRLRIAAFLLEAGREAGTRPFTIPYNRAGLAAYLGCERSALSRELSHMAGEGLLETQRSRFRLPDPGALRALFPAN